MTYYAYIFRFFFDQSIVCSFVLTLGSLLLITGGQTFYFAIIQICDKCTS